MFFQASKTQFQWASQRDIYKDAWLGIHILLSKCHLMEPILVMSKDMRRVARVASSKEQGKVLKYGTQKVPDTMAINT